MQAESVGLDEKRERVPALVTEVSLPLDPEQRDRHVALGAERKRPLRHAGEPLARDVIHLAIRVRQPVPNLTLTRCKNIFALVLRRRLGRDRVRQADRIE